MSKAELLKELTETVELWRKKVQYDAFDHGAAGGMYDATHACMDDIAAIIARHGANGNVVAELGPLTVERDGACLFALRFEDYIWHRKEENWEIRPDRSYRMDLIELPED